MKITFYQPIEYTKASLSPTGLLKLEAAIEFAPAIGLRVRLPGITATIEMVEWDRWTGNIKAWLPCHKESRHMTLHNLLVKNGWEDG